MFNLKVYRAINNFDNFEIYIGKNGAMIVCKSGFQTPVNLCYREIVREATWDAKMAMCVAWTGFEIYNHRFNLKVYPDGPGKFGATIYEVNERGETDFDTYREASLVCADRNTVIDYDMPEKYRVKSEILMTVE